MAAGVSLDRGISSTWNKLLAVVNNALVYLDNPAAEILHWSGAIKDIFDAGALAIYDISSCSRSGNESETKAVFVVTTLLHGQILTYISDIVQASDFQHCTILCSVTEPLHSWARQSGTWSDEAVFGELSKKLREWMGNMYATVDVHHFPLFHAQVYQGLFITPAFSRFFPLLPSDVPRLQGFLRSTGDKRVLNNLNEIEITALPHNLQMKIRMFASGLSGLFETLNMNEDCYGIGYLSKLIASELANMPSARVRRKVASHRGSLVLIDRTLDLIGPCSHGTETLADRIIQLLPRLPHHSSDVAVDMTPLTAPGSLTPDTVVPGCLAHPTDSAAQSLLTTFFTRKEKESVMELARQLVDAITKEALPLKPKGSLGKVTPKQLQDFTGLFRNNPKAFKIHCPLLQLAMAAVAAHEHEDNLHLEHLLSTEKLLLLNADEEQESTLAEICRLLQTDKDKRKYSFEDVLLLVSMMYSLIGEKCYHSPAQEEEIQKTLVDCLIKGELRCTTKGFLGDELVERSVRRKVADAFERLRGIGSARDQLQQLREVYQKGTALRPARYHSLIHQVVDLIFSSEKPELVDIEFKSHGLKDYLKTGFSLFMNVSKPRPNDLPVLVLFVVGGITCSEVRQIREALSAHRSNTQVIVGSTKILKTEDVFHMLYCQDNLFPTLEGEVQSNDKSK